MNLKRNEDLIAESPEEQLKVINKEYVGLNRKNQEDLKGLTNLVQSKLKESDLKWQGLSKT